MIMLEMIISLNLECYLFLVMIIIFRMYVGVIILLKNRIKFWVFSENCEGG